MQLIIIYHIKVILNTKSTQSMVVLYDCVDRIARTREERKNNENICFLLKSARNAKYEVRNGSTIEYIEWISNKGKRRSKCILRTKNEMFTSQILYANYELRITNECVSFLKTLTKSYWQT